MPQSYDAGSNGQMFGTGFMQAAEILARRQQNGAPQTNVPAV